MKLNKILYYSSFVFIIFSSIITLYSMKELSNYYNTFFIKQIVWYLISFILFIIIKRINITKIFNYSFIFYLISLILLIIVLLFGNTINGSKAWINFYFFSFQPSELMKLSLAMFLSSFTSTYLKIKNKNEIKYILMILIITFIPCLLVFLEPDTGAVIFYLLILLTNILNAKINKKWYILFTIFLSLIMFIFTYLYLNNRDLLINLIGTSFFYRIDRLINFKDGYQITNALTLIGSASLLGNVYKDINLIIPECHTDFIYAYIIGRFGFISGLSILIAYFFLNYFLIKKTHKIKNKKYKIFTYSFLAIFLFQELYNLLMNIGLIPIMGIPLPFLSYGGTTILIYFIFLGIIKKFDNS